jgi:hypothetical protein
MQEVGKNCKVNQTRNRLLVSFVPMVLIDVDEENGSNDDFGSC